MFKIKTPIKPIKPEEPVKPEEQIKQIIYIDLNNKTLSSVLKEIPNNINFDDVCFGDSKEFSYDDTCTSIMYFSLVDNVSYKEDYKKYIKDLKVYNKKIKHYNNELKLYKIEKIKLLKKELKELKEK